MKIVKFGTAALIAFVGCVLKVCMLIIGLFNFSIVTPTINTIADIISYSLIGYFFIMNEEIIRYLFIMTKEIFGWKH